MLKNIKLVKFYTYNETFDKSHNEIFIMFQKETLYNSNKNYIILSDESNWFINIYEIENCG